MCGRYASSRHPEDLADSFGAQDATAGRCLPADFNVAPTKEIHAVLVRHGVRQLRVARWGLVPSWAPDTTGGARLINARLETAANRPAFRSAWLRRRCLVPADGWYEWAPTPDGRRPHFITPADGSLLAFAGLYEIRAGLLTTAIVTTAATGPLAAVHDRMPVVLGRAGWVGWLGPSAGWPGPEPSPHDLGPPTRAPDPEILAGLEIRPVGPAVGNVANNGPALTATASRSVPPAAPAPLALF